MVGAVVGNVTPRPAARAARARRPTLNTAEMSGMAAVMSEPNMNTSRSRAQPRPMASEVVSLVFWPIWPAPAP